MSMAITLQNQNLAIQIDLPHEQYQFSRFDWTGKISNLRFKGIPIAGVELYNQPEDPIVGKGFYNEFGIDMPIGFDEADEGDWFHKIGIGLLRKAGDTYQFHRAYEIQPAQFDTQLGESHLHISCQSPSYNGYAYLLKKKIILQDSGFAIEYFLKNQGDKKIITNEYNHNFLTIDNLSMGEDYVLTFPFEIQTKKMGEMVNPEGLINIGQQALAFVGTPEKQFFFSNLTGGAPVPATWTLENLRRKIAISESGDFHTRSINVWGWRHVISPELFISIELEPGKIMQWTRSYQVYELA